jgi:hypothetical protein
MVNPIDAYPGEGWCEISALEQSWELRIGRVNGPEIGRRIDGFDGNFRDRGASHAGEQQTNRRKRRHQSNGWGSLTLPVRWSSAAIQSALPGDRLGQGGGQPFEPMLNGPSDPF